jgi:hypothetical protein
MSIDLVSRRLATLASTNAASALAQAATAYARAPQVALFSSIASANIDASIATIATTGHGAAGRGAALYVCDSLANAALASTYPDLCSASADGRYWRLMPQAGVIGVDQTGAVAGDSSKAVSNVNRIAKVLNYLTYVCGGGTLFAGVGRYWLDGAALGTWGINLPSNVTIEGAGREATVWASTTPATGNILSTSSGSNCVLRSMGFVGRLALTGITRGAMVDCSVTGSLSSEVQYAETGLVFANYFGTAGQSFSDGTNALDGSDFTRSQTGSVLSVTLSSNAALLGATRYARYIVSDAIPLDPAKRYVLTFGSGFMGGVGGARPMVLMFDASGNPLDSGQGNTPAHMFDQNVDTQNGTLTAYISGASSIKLALGAFRNFSTALGLTATWDVSKITLYAAVNDMASFAATGSSTPTAQSQLSLTQCSDFLVQNCDFRMIDRTVIALLACSGTLVSQCRFRFVIQGIVDNNGTGNCILDNNFDLRLRTTGGSLIGSRAFRARAIGGSGATKGVYSRNVIRGASWAIESLPNDPTKTLTVNDNVIEAEFTGLSLACCNYVARGNRILLASDGRFGIEAPGDNPGLTPTYGNCRAMIENNDIRWAEFSGYPGFGVSAAEASSATVKGGFIRAPILIQNAGTQSGGTLRVSGVDGEYGEIALLGRNGPVYADFGSITPYQLCHALGTAATSAVFDLQPVSPVHPVSISATYVMVGLAALMVCAGGSQVRASFPSVLPTSTSYTTDYYLRFIAPSGTWQGNWHIDGFNLLSAPSGMGSNRWCLIVGTPYTGSQLVMRNNRWAGVAVPVPDGGSYTINIVKGDANLAGSYSQTLGTIAAGASVQITGLTLRGASVGNDAAYMVQSATAGGLSGLSARVWPTADNTITLEVTNITSAAITRSSAQTLLVRGMRYL